MVKMTSDIATERAQRQPAKETQRGGKEGEVDITLSPSWFPAVDFQKKAFPRCTSSHPSSSFTAKHVKGYEQQRRQRKSEKYHRHDNYLEDPVALVRAFVEACQSKKYRVAADWYLSQTTLQVSYPGWPFLKSSSDWYRHQQQQPESNHNHYCNGIQWDVLQPGVHERQVIRRGRSWQHGAVIEVFELAPETIISTTTTTCTTAIVSASSLSSPQSSSQWRIVSVYLRLTPLHWVPFPRTQRCISNVGPTKRNRFVHGQRLSKRQQRQSCFWSRSSLPNFSQRASSFLTLPSSVDWKSDLMSNVDDDNDHSNPLLEARLSSLIHT